MSAIRQGKDRRLEKLDNYKVPETWFSYYLLVDFVSCWRGDKLRMKAQKTIIVVIIVAGLVGFLTYEMLSLGQIECKLCIDFNGRRDCPTALGPNEEEAIAEAHRNACAKLSSGVTDTLACNRSERTQINCFRSSEPIN